MIATIGFFDGVHLGHQALLQRVVQLAREHNEESAVITFRPHPREVLYQQKLPLLTSLTEKKKLIHSQGITTIIVLPFTSAFSTLGAEMFFQTYLKEKYGVSTLVIGKDHHMGSDRLGGEQLQVLARRLGMNVEILEDVQENGQRVSSTQLRKQVLRQQMLDKRLALSPEQWES
ncbi:MAG: hypothetical protein LBP53_07275 [Candidatus Peribacteria bacterium]|jgi:riboflavin kinase/FMN adenylyltransferase|nr:hypothetical protein [Candidatus Peribacteria bacterium]